MSKPVPLFRTTNWSSYSQALKRRGSLMVWFDPEMSWFAVPSGKAGHPERFSAAAIQFCLSIKVLFGLPLRPTNDRVCGEPAGSERACLAGAGFHNALPPAEAPESADPVSGIIRPAESAGGQHRD